VEAAVEAVVEVAVEVVVEVVVEDVHVVEVVEVVVAAVANKVGDFIGNFYFDAINFFPVKKNHLSISIIEYWISEHVIQTFYEIKTFNQNTKL
jgi:hypothetical protein